MNGPPGPDWVRERMEYRFSYAPDRCLLIDEAKLLRLWREYGYPTNGLTREQIVNFWSHWKTTPTEWALPLLEVLRSVGEEIANSQSEAAP